jgi:hypothetical protein
MTAADCARDLASYYRIEAGAKAVSSAADFGKSKETNKFS